MPELSRTIQWYGLLRPPEDFSSFKYWYLTADLVRPPQSTYDNRRYPVPQGFWGYLQSIYGGRVLQTYRLSYQSEIIAYSINTNLFLHQSISCHLEAMLTSFINVALFLKPGYPTQRDNPIKDWVNLSFPIEEFRVRLLSEDTVFKFTLHYDNQDVCSVDGSFLPPQPPPPPEAPDNPFPAGTPNEDLPPISPAYDGENDGGLTYNPTPNTDEPLGDECTAYTLTFSYAIDSNGNGNYVTQTEIIRIYGKLYGLTVQRNQNGDPNVFADCQGLPDYESCSPTKKLVAVTGFIGLGNQANIQSPTVVSLV